jgi:hypothetical protein
MKINFFRTLKKKLSNMPDYAVLGYSTINIGDDIQSVVASTLVNSLNSLNSSISYIIQRDDFDQVYDLQGNPCELHSPVYLIMNGWFMHNPSWKTGNHAIKFPITHKYIVPVYISTCLSKDVPLLYSDTCIEHYKRWEPLLCRDRTTQERLLEKGVRAEFYGCLTQLLDRASLPDNEDYKRRYSDSVFYIDCEDNRMDSMDSMNITDKKVFHHYLPELEEMNVAQRLEYAKDLLCKYKYARKVYTTRLHAFLPCRAMGVDVEYVGEWNYRVADVLQEPPSNTAELKEIFYQALRRVHDAVTGGGGGGGGLE